MLLAVLAAPLAFGAAAVAEPAFDARPWLEDLDQAREAVATRYANLEWLVSEREVNPSTLFAEARDRIGSARDAQEARAAFDHLARAFGDGHVQFRWPDATHSHSQQTAACSDLGYSERMQGLPTAALIPGYRPLETAPGAQFPSGLLHVGKQTVGIVKIGVFTPQGYPALCEAARAALQTASAADIEQWSSNQMTVDLEAQLRHLKASGATVLMVDLIDNGGGTEWAEAAARIVTAVQLKAEHIAFARGAHWQGYFEMQESKLRQAAQTAPSEDRAWLLALADRVAERKVEAGTACDSEPLWQGRQMSCSWLGDGFYATGLLDSAKPDQLRGRKWATDPDLFTPLEYPYHEAVWRGPLIVLVNGHTGSAAEEFTAELQDNHAAIVLGSPTAGAGCGHTNGGTPTTLAHSGAILELPDCARIRRDGTNEIMGIQPDILVGLRNEDGPNRRAMRIAKRLPEAVRQAVSQSQ